MAKIDIINESIHLINAHVSERDNTKFFKMLADFALRVAKKQRELCAKDYEGINPVTASLIREAPLVEIINGK